MNNMIMEIKCVCVCARARVHLDGLNTEHKFQVWDSILGHKKNYNMLFHVVLQVPLPRCYQL